MLCLAFPARFNRAHPSNSPIQPSRGETSPRAQARGLPSCGFTPQRCSLQLSYLREPNLSELPFPHLWMGRAVGCCGVRPHTGVSWRKLQEIVKDREAWRAGVRGVAKSQTGLNSWATMPYLACQAQRAALKRETHPAFSWLKLLGRYLPSYMVSFRNKGLGFDSQVRRILRRKEGVATHPAFSPGDSHGRRSRVGSGP